MDKWLRSKEFRDKFNFSSATLWRLVHLGNIQCKEMYGVKYFLDETVDLENKNGSNIIYCRVSDKSDKAELARQESMMRTYCVTNGIAPDEVITDIASGLDDSRAGYNDIIAKVIDGKVNTVYVSSKCRLVRMGFETIENIFAKHGTKIKVVNLSNESDYKSELKSDLAKITEDMISLIKYKK